MVATWIVAAIVGDRSEPPPATPAPQKLALVPSVQPPNVTPPATGPDPIFSDPGATSSFSRDLASALPTNAFQVANAAPPVPDTVAAAANAQPAQEVAAADVPLPPVRDVPGAVPDAGDLASQAPPAVVANVPLPPVRDVPVVVASVEPAPALAPPSVPDAPIAQTDVPLPPSRPVIEMPVAPQPSPRATPRPAPAPARTASQAIVANLAPPAADNRSFVQRLLNLPAHPPGPVLAYAKPEDEGFGNTPNYGRPAIPPFSGGRTAIYDISTHTVYLPNGEQLEAHSGLGRNIDDPGSVNEKNRGATPPHLYDLTLREKLFHGVQALRLTPVGAGSMYGRIGLLAHTYMLGPSGQSNGCVSFRDYRRFLQAYMSGEVTHLAVVAHRT